MGTVPPTSTTARWMQRTMILVESNSVPSQSKAIRSNWRGRSWAWSANFLQFRRQRGEQFDALAGGGVVEL